MPSQVIAKPKALSKQSGNLQMKITEPGPDNKETIAGHDVTFHIDVGWDCASSEAGKASLRWGQYARLLK